MKKRILAVVMALALVFGLSGMALAGNDADVDQEGTVNTILIKQIGDSEIDIDQDAGTTNWADVYQRGDGNDVDVRQDAKTSNWLFIDQLGLRLALDNDNLLDLNQVAGTSNEADVVQSGNRNDADVRQDAGTFNRLFIDQLGDDNRLVGANSNGTINPLGAATQISATSHNWLDCIQLGDNNKVGLYQNAHFFNNAFIEQFDGGNSLVAWQHAPGGSNELTIEQGGGMTASVVQNATTGNNVIIITQE